jgi:hypothetical protein
VMGGLLGDVGDGVGLGGAGFGFVDFCGRSQNWRNVSGDFPVALRPRISVSNSGIACL